MSWFRKKFMWASLGLLSASASLSAQGTVWRPVIGNEPLETRPTPAHLSLGRPTPLELQTPGVVQAFMPITHAPAAGVQRTSYVARGVFPAEPEEPKSLNLPTETLPLEDAKQVPLLSPAVQPTQAAQPLPKGKGEFIEINPSGTTKATREAIAMPRVSTPTIDGAERIIILPENGAAPADDESRTVFRGFGVGAHRLYAQGEWLLWTARGFHVPPLATTASANDDPNTRGTLGFQNTRLIYGDGNVLGGLRSGARFTLGYDFDPCGMCTIEGSFFFLGRKNDTASFDSGAFPVIGRPFFNINTGMQDRELTTTPEFTSGNLQIRTSTSLLGAEVNKKILLWHGCDFELTGLVGFRYLNLEDQLNIEERTTFINAVPAFGNNPPLFNAGDRTFVFDRFDTHNRFYGGQFGLNAQWLRGPWSLDARFKLALGVTSQNIAIDGGQRFDRANGTVQNFPGGLYALPGANIGSFAQSRFGVVPELGLKLGYNFTDNIRVFVGYDFLYWSSVVRPGDQIDPALDANKIPNFGANFPNATQARPRVPFRTSSYWALGLNAGVEFRY